jgi:hypothetical protein
MVNFLCRKAEEKWGVGRQSKRKGRDVGKDKEESKP